MSNGELHTDVLMPSHPDISMFVTACPDSHQCYNDSPCVEESVGSFGCDCTAIDGADIYAGVSCEHQATSYCNQKNVPDSVHFCANEGTCVSYIGGTEHHGCVCPDGYEGEHCELLEPMTLPNSIHRAPPTHSENTLFHFPGLHIKFGESDSSSSSSPAVIVATVVVVVFMTLTGLAVCLIRRRRRLAAAREVEAVVTQASGSSDENDDVVKPPKEVV